MNIKDQIRAEIDKLYGEYKDKFHQSGDQYHLGLIDGLDMAERVLDSLPEQPVEGLEEAAKKYLDGIFGKGKHEDFYVQLFKAGAKWMKAKMMEEAVEANLLSVEGDSYGIVSYTFQGRRFPAAFSGKCFGYKIIVMKDEK